MNAEFQRIAKRDKKAFLSGQCKEIEENSIFVGKDYRSHQENQRYQGKISSTDGHNKGQKWFGPTEAEDSKKRWEDTKKNYTENIFMTQLISMV